MAEAQLQLEEVRAVLLRNDDTFRELVSEHHALDEQIRHLSSSIYLTDRQQLEEIELKKRKLALKDRIEAMVRSRQTTSPPMRPQ
jgi:uncharacterized protein YdcH (DUF465 family)